MAKGAVALEIPRDVLYTSRMSLDDLRKELAIHLFEEGKLSLGKAKELAGISLWEFQQLLGSRGISMHYDVEEYESDLETLKELNRL